MSEEGDYGELDENESKILIALVKLGNQYNQRELWRMAGINSKTGIPALSKLERRGFIERDKVGGDKRSQYVIRLTEAGIKKAKTLMEGMKSGMGTDIELLMGIPCFFCPYIKECGRGGHTSPETCELLGRWIYNISTTFNN
ncbi:MarR family transcriptional regulator [Thermocladium modestius]|nr:MarR family transcriptional regulator [Thermocladium modestius]